MGAGGQLLQDFEILFYIYSAKFSRKSCFFFKVTVSVTVTVTVTVTETKCVFKLLITNFGNVCFSRDYLFVLKEELELKIKPKYISPIQV